ncbi:hypothetical protein HB662_16625 [Roseomonas frigidaquae]|uniref:Tail tube protein n=1 Tax=Falsiroseomonas frigidaquae TaxID=487318 RepID=A0ABX1F267_9PROT|nr:hypothetical protein [Falsiroseomonas frigidaquae]NKE46409.1 hypothetical protein [Falsiroseomonas frigidaquae]
MALTAVALCSRALLRLGAQPVASLDEGTAEAEVAANLYASTRDALLSAHPWSFATGQTSLPRLAATPPADMAHAFQLPTGFLRALSAGSGGRGGGMPYRLHEDKLQADATSVTLTYIFRPDESAFPPFFAQALVARLAAEFCLPLTDSASRAEMLFRLAEGEMRSARLIDSQQDTPRAIEHFPLIDVRG